MMPMDRRTFLQGAAALPLATLPFPAAPARSFQFAFLTDTHHKNPSTLAAIGRCVAKLRQVAPDVRLIIHGGDLLNLADAQSGGRTLAQFSELLPLFQGFSFHATIGNHDLAALKSADDPLRGKAAFTKAVGPTFSRINAGGLTFLILDSVQVTGTTFTGAISSECLTWL
ncbi:MAG: hypothetical protein C4320_00005, partial [Armatimonadota bacterium]